MREETAPPMPMAGAIANVSYHSQQGESATRAAAFVDRVGSALAAMQQAVDSKPQILGGAPVLKGTRFSIAQLFAELAEGESIDAIAADFELDRASLNSILHALAVCLEQPAGK